ncbi:MAG: DMT family transporter [Ilumatobacteraceae bacterium]
MTRRGVLRCSLAAVLFGISAPAASRLAGDMGAFTLAGLLYLGAAIAVLPFLGRVRPTRAAVRRGASRLATAVVFGGAIGPVLLAAGLSHAPAASASLLLNLELVFTTVLAYFVFREHVGPRVVAGTVMVVIAGVVLGWSGSADLRWGALLIAGACLCWGIDNCVTANLDELAPVHITLVKGAVAGSANLAIGLALGGAPAGWPILGALLVGAFGYGASITLWVAGARDLGAARGQLVFATAPFVGAIVAWTVFADPVVGRQLVALLIAAIGVSFVLRSGHAHEHEHHAIEHDHEHTHDDGHHDHSHSGEDAGRHQHAHRHEPLVHAHPHVPDLHHRHEHAQAEASL